MVRSAARDWIELALPHGVRQVSVIPPHRKTASVPTIHSATAKQKITAAVKLNSRYACCRRRPRARRNHGQVVGCSDIQGGQIKDRPVTPADIAASIYHHMGVPLDATYVDDSGRPNFMVEEDGKPIRELF